MSPDVSFDQNHNHELGEQVHTIIPSMEAPTHPVAEPTTNNTSDQPLAVVKVLSVRGVEYLMMSLVLWLIAVSLIWGLLSVVNYTASFSILAFPASLLIVCLPIFAYLFLRLRKAELANPSLRLEPSKRRMTQITQVLAFLTCLTNLIVFVYSLMQRIGGESQGSIVKSILSLLVVLLVAGGLLVYYWIDEHRLVRG